MSKWTGKEVRALRTAALRMTQESFAEAVGFVAPTVRKWERATVTRPVAGGSAAALDTMLTRLNEPERERFRTALDATATSAEPAPAPALPGASPLGVHPWEVEDDVNRRDFAILLGSALLAPALVTDTAHLGVSDANRLAAGVIELARQEQRVGGATLVQIAIATLERAKTLLNTCAFDERSGQAFMSAAGNLAVLAGWVAYDADKHELARHCYADAFALANQADDTALTVHACVNAALQYASLGRKGLANPHMALVMTSRARDLVRGAPPGRIHALIATREAQAYGVLGDRAGFRRAIATAWRELDFAAASEPLESCPQWLGFVTPTEVRFHEALGFGDLGEHSTAVALAAQVATEQSGARNAANYRAWWATALARLGDLPTATAEGLAVLAELESHSIASPRTLRVLLPVRHAVGDEAGDFATRYDGIARQKVSA
ncbi:helix-turn-helix domain-containing protein [Nocardia jejuensis]|uniref:helix-turn-helix domain-containing protein n=1 Tax=Nocardia jejuensis TaxID=328049 RepID=UPI0012FB348E|nr:helix-turn-helix domain-containing protein [Nocardia jejuensis]